MSGLRNFLLMAGGVGLLMLLVWMLSPRRFNWDPTFSPTSTQPFGMELFDEVVASSCPQGYEVADRSFFDLLNGDSASCFSVLAVAGELNLGRETMGHIMQLARRGHRVMLVTAHVYTAMRDSLGISGHSWVTLDYMTSTMRYDSEPTAVRWTGNDGVFDERLYPVSAPLHRAKLEVDSAATDVTVLACNWGEEDDDTCAVAVSKRVGQGEVIVVAMPLLFTNYGMLAEGQAPLIFRFLSLLGPHPIVRTTLYTTDDEDDGDLMSYIKSQPPLRWAYYLSLLTVLVFMVTTARRRQRAIPVVRPPVNHSLEFIKLIGTLYHQQHDYADLVHKKYVYTAEQLRRTLHVDITNPADDAHSVPVIARNAGLTDADVRQTLADVRRQVAQMGTLTADQMKHFIDRLAALNPD